MTQPFAKKPPPRRNFSGVEGRADKRALGAHAETLALNMLRRHGLRLVARNFLCRHGEIDLIMRDGDCLVFVEVRSRRHSGWGSAAESIGHRKQRRLAATAEFFLLSHRRWQRSACRFDAVLFDGGLNDNNTCWHKDIFQINR